jgi:Flp pilus assembly protein TadG
MKTQSRLCSFLRDKSGQFAILFAVLMIPLFAAVGLAIDYTSAVQTHTRLQDSTDAAALFVTTEYRRTGKLPANADVLNFVSANYNVSGGQNEPELQSIVLKDGKVILETKVNLPWMIMGILGNPNKVIGVNSIVNISSDVDIEIALVLDTTESMRALSYSSSSDLEPPAAGPNAPAPYFPNLIPNVTRIDALKFSAKRFTDTVFALDGNKGRTRVSVVPFAQYVNVGTDKRGASWLTVPNDTASTGTTCEDYRPIISSSNCHPAFYISDGAQIPYTQCTNVYGDVKKRCKPTGGTTWKGCVGSRNEPLNLRDSSPGSTFTGIMNVWCASPIQPLTGNKSQILSTIYNLSTHGNTYIPEGVMWGMRVLSTSVPYTEVKTDAGLNKVKKIMVLMTDGDNQAVANIPAAPTHRNIDPGQSDYNANRTKTDNWTLEACNEAKKAGIEVYTISFGSDISAKAQAVVKACASDNKHYFNAVDAAALSAAFQTIASEVGRIYLAG